MRFGTLDWSVPDPVNNPRRVRVRYYQAVRGSLSSYLSNVGSNSYDAETCTSGTTNCKRFSLWNGRVRHGNGNGYLSSDNYLFRLEGTTPRLTTATSRTYSDGTVLPAGENNWFLIQRTYYYTYPNVGTYNLLYSTCCRQYSGVRNTGTSDYFYIRASINLAQVPNGVYQNPHCSGNPIITWPFNGATSVISINNFCSSPHGALTYTWSSNGNSGLKNNGNSLPSPYQRPTLNANGAMNWNPSHDGLYAFQITVSDTHGNSNTLDCVFDVTESAANTNPYFVEIRTTLGGSTPTSTTDIFNPATQTVSVGQTLNLGVWAYAPTGSMNQITYTWTTTEGTTITNACSGSSAYCEIQFSYTPQLGAQNANLCLVAVSSAAGVTYNYVGAPSDPSNEVTFCIPITIAETAYLYLSGYMRDFRSAEASATGMVYTTSSTVTEANFVQRDLDSNLKPQFDSSVTSTTGMTASKFNTWFQDTANSQRLTVSITLELVSGTAGQPGSVYRCNFDPYYPINCAGYEASASCDPQVSNNKYFSYEVYTYFTYTSGISINFRVTDFLWVFIDGKQVLAYTKQKDDPDTVTLNLDQLSNLPKGGSLSLTDGESYSMALFFAHRSSGFDPVLNWEVPGGTLCDAVSGANTTFSIPSFSGQSNSIYDTQGGAGMISISGNDLQLTTAQTTRSAAVYHATAGVAQLYSVRDGFETTFKYTISNCAGAGTCTGSQVPGFAFVIQAEGPTARGGAAAGLGYEGITSAVAIEFDGVQDSSKSDPSYSHISYHRSSQAGAAISAVEVTSPANAYSSDAIDLSRSGTAHDVKIQYLPGQFQSGSSSRIGWIYVFIDNEPTPRFEYSISSTDFDMFSNNAYVGFTAGTTSSAATPIKISNWAFKVIAPAATLTTFSSKSTLATAGTQNQGTVIQARDSCNSDLTTGGNTAKFSATMTGAATITPTFVDQGDGKYKVSYTPTVAGQYTLRIFYDGQPINNGANTVTVNVQASSTVSLTNTQIPTITTGLTVGSTNTAVFKLRDQYNNTITADLIGISNPPVIVSVTPDPTQFTLAGTKSVVFNPSTNQYTLSFTSRETRSGGFVVRFAYNGQDITGAVGSPQTIQFVAGTLDYTQCSIDTASPPSTSLTAGTNGTFYVVARDAGSNQILSNPTGYSARFTQNSTALGVNQERESCVWDTTAQKFRCTAAIKIAGTYTIQPSIYQSGSKEGDIPGSYELTVNPGADSSMSTPTALVESDPVAGNQTAGLIRTVYIQARDQYGNKRSTTNSAGTFSLSLSSGASTTGSVTYLSDGKYTLQYQLDSGVLPANGKVVVTCKHDTDTISNGVFTDTWVAGTVARVKAASAISANVGSSATVTLLLEDAYNNEITADTSAGVNMGVTLPSGSNSFATISYSSPTHSAVWQTTEAGTHTLNFYAGAILSTTNTTVVAAGAVASAIVTTSDAGWQDTESGSTKFFRISSTDQYGNLVGSADSGSAFTLDFSASGCSLSSVNPASQSNGVYNFTWTNGCSQGTAVTLNVKLSGSTVQTTTITTLAPGVTNGKSTVASGTDFETVVSGVAFSFNIDAKDASSNARTSGNDGFAASIEPLNLNYTDANGVTPGTPTFSSSAGSSTVGGSLTLSYAGIYRMRIYDGLELEESLNGAIYGGPGYLIRVSAGAVARYQAGSSNLASVIRNGGSPLTTVTHIAGLSSSLTLALYDAYLALAMGSSRNVWATVTLSSGTVLNVTASHSSSNTWSLSLSETEAGTHSVTFYADGTLIGSSSYQYTVTAASAVANRFNFTLPTTGRAGTSISLVACFYDTYWNPAAIPSYSNIGFTFTPGTGSAVAKNPSAGSVTLGGATNCFTLPVVVTLAETYTVSATLSSAAARYTRSIEVKNSLTVGASYSRLFGVQNRVAGTSYSLLLEVKDEYDNDWVFESAYQSTFRCSISEPGNANHALQLGSGAEYQGGGNWSLSVTGCAAGSDCAATCHSCIAGTYAFQFFIGAVDVFNGISKTLNVTSASPHGQQISYIYTPDASTATSLSAGNVKTGISFQAYDAFGNVATTGISGDEFTAAVYDVAPSCANDNLNANVPSSNFTVTVAHSAAGIYDVSILPYALGTFHLAVSFDNSLVCDAYQTLSVAADSFAANATQVAGYSDVEVVQNGTMLLTFTDKFGNLVYTGANTNVTILGLGALTLHGFTQTGNVWSRTAANVQTLTVKYETTTTGAYPFSIVVDSVPVPSENFVAGTVAVATSPTISVTVGGLSGFVISPFQTMRTTQYYYLQLTGQDAYGNNVTRSDFTVTMRFTSSDFNYFVLAETYEAYNGTAWLRFTFDLPGTYTPAVTITRGNVTIVNAQALSNVNVDPATCYAKNPSTPYRCQDGTCVASYSSCSDASSTLCSDPAQVKCAVDGSCRTNATGCPCPSGQTRCASGACGTNCAPAPPCEADQVLCTTQKVCRASYADCPSPRTCARGTLMCPDGVSCARSLGECNDFNRSACPLASMYRCQDGSCALTLNDCPTAPTCPSGQLVCPDGSCATSNADCNEVNECKGSLTRTFRCQDGTCVDSAENCPSSTVCPPAYLLCQDGSCAASLSACGSFTRACMRNETTCPDGSCARNPRLCSAKSTCPTSKSVLCPDGSCVELQSLCAAPASCSSVRCADGSCVSNEALCPTGRQCTDDYPVLCNDGSCQNVSSSCPSTTGCGDKLRCPDGSCRVSLSECPTFSRCPSTFPVRCSDGSCRVSPSQCLSPSLLKCPANTVRCPSGSCAATLAVCPTSITCDAASGQKRCVDGTCRATCPEDTDPGSDPSPCPPNKVQCPQSAVGFSCRDSLADCPVGIVCPVDNPVRCIDSSCRARLSDCPASPTTWSTQVVCPDGSYEVDADSCGAAVSCPAASPYSCWDSTCRAAPQDCPDAPKCQSNAPFLCPDGSCKSFPWRCRSQVSCPSIKPVRCPLPMDGCKATSAECTDPSSITNQPADVCPIGSVLCRGSAGGSPFCARQGECQMATCPSYLPYQCPSGLCVTDNTKCEKANGCPYGMPKKCWSGECVANSTDCGSESAGSSYSCQNGFTGAASSLVCVGGSCQLGQGVSSNAASCPDGSCLATTTGSGVDQSGCPNANGCTGSQVRCNDGSCASSAASCTSSFGGNQVCPPQMPYRCPEGICAKGSSFCPEIPGSSSCGNGQVRCASGDCVEDQLQCPLITPCYDKVRCADGTCRETASSCPLNNKCPSDARYRCQTGECAESSQSCSSPDTGCPADRSTRCDNGACVVSAALCDNSTAITSSGCAAGEFQCWNNECVTSAYLCPPANGCARGSPYRCPDRSCVADPTSCTAGARCTTTTCADGSCVSNRRNCKTSYLCDIHTPVRCADGTCKNYWASAVIGSPSVSSSANACSSVISCPGGVACADGSCQNSLDLCPSNVACPTATPYLCSNGICATNAAACSSTSSFACPAASPILCRSGSCASTMLQCVDTLAPMQDATKVQCFDGTEADTYESCQLIRNDVGANSRPALQSLTRAASPLALAVSGCAASEYQCPDGACVPQDAKYTCARVTRCSGSTPYRCNSGSCAASAGSCPSSTACTGGLTICADGSCRASADCPRYDGCPSGKYLCQFDQLCYDSASACVNTTTSWSASYLDNPKISQIGVCSSNCYRDLRPDFTPISVYPGQSVQAIVVDDVSLGPALTISVPAGAFSNASTLFIAGAADSELASTENINRKEYFDMLGEVTPVAKTLLSAPFYCWVGQETAVNFNLNVTVTAQIDRTYPHNSKDICLAKLQSDNSWRCLYPTYKDREAYPLTLTNGNQVSGTFGYCNTLGSAGTLYAFIYVPGTDNSQVVDNGILGMLERYWWAIALGVIGGFFLIVGLSWFCFRKYRYRKKYQQKREKLKDRERELKALKRDGVEAYATGKNEKMEMNPLQINLKRMNDLQGMLPSQAKRDEQIKNEIEVKKQREKYIGVLESKNESLMQIVEDLQQQLRTESDMFIGHDTNVTSSSHSAGPRTPRGRRKEEKEALRV